MPDFAGDGGTWEHQEAFTEGVVSEPGLGLWPELPGPQAEGAAPEGADPHGVEYGGEALQAVDYDVTEYTDHQLVDYGSTGDYGAAGYEGIPEYGGTGEYGGSDLGASGHGSARAREAREGGKKPRKGKDKGAGER